MSVHNECSNNALESTYREGATYYLVNKGVQKYNAICMFLSVPGCAMGIS